MGTLTVDAGSPAAVTQANDTTATLATASFTAPTNSLLVAIWAANTAAGVDPATPTISGGGLTWTLQQWKHRADGVSPTVDAEVAIWTAPNASSGSVTVTVTSGVGATRNEAALQVFAVVDSGGGMPAVGTSGKFSNTGITLISQGYTATVTGSLGFMPVCDFDAFSGSWTAGSGTTVTSSGVVGSTHTVGYGFLQRTTADGVAGVTTTISATTSFSSTNLGWAWVEITPVPALSTFNAAHAVTIG